MNEHEVITPELTHLDCLGEHPNSPCEGVVEFRYALPMRFRSNGTAIMFARCEKHYEEYEANYEARERLRHDYEASLYCKHGTYVGDWAGADILCGRCENE